MNELCVDASLVAKLVVSGESLRAHARQLYYDAAIAEAALIAPPVLESEVDSIIQARAFDGRFSGRQARDAYSGIDRLAIEIVNTPGMRQRARHIAEQFKQPRVYDSTYAALAEVRGCEFWTADYAFYAAVKDELLYVRFLADYPLP